MTGPFASGRVPARRAGRRFAGASAALFAVLLAFGAEAKTFRAADTQAEDYPTVQALMHMDRVIRERTEGRHGLDVFHSRQLGEEKETVEQTRMGAIDLNRTNVATLGGLVPEADLLALPFIFRSVDHLRRVLDGEIGEELLASFEPHGLVGLAFYDSGARSIYTRQGPVRSLRDLKGLRIRIQQSGLMAELFRALGAEPVMLPYGQVATALQAGLIDGAENNWPSYVTTGHARSAPFYTLTEHTMSPEVLVMSMKAWKALTSEDQAVFRAAARESSEIMRRQWRALEQGSRETAAREGAAIVADFERAAFEAASRPVRERLLADPRMRRLAERIETVP